MALVPTTDPTRRRKTPGHLTGMTASATGAYDFTGMTIKADQIVGAFGDYTREPHFSAGAWRGSAVALGAIDRLVELFLQELHSRSRSKNVHQQVRIGEALILQKTATFWVNHCR